MATPQTIAAPTLGKPDEPCARCGAPLAADQRYCLHCGHRRADSRVPFPESLQQTTGESNGAAPPQEKPGGAAPGWSPTTAFLGVGVVALVLGVGVLIGRSVSKEPKRAAAPQVITVGGAGGTQAAATDAYAGGSFKSDWPAGKDGWTVQLQALSKEGTQPAAVAAAKSAAAGKGAPKVGALDSDEYPSLAGGQYVIYSGVYASQKDAQKALGGVKKSFPAAKVVHVSKKGGGAEKVNTKGATTLSPKQLQDLDKTSGLDYYKKAQKLPKVIATPGKAPPKDTKAPGAGSAGEAIE